MDAICHSNSIPTLNPEDAKFHLLIKKAVQEALEEFKNEVVKPLKSELMAIRTQNVALIKELEILNANKNKMLADEKGATSYAKAVKKDIKERSKSPLVKLDKMQNKSEIPEKVNKSDKIQLNNFDEIIHLNSDLSNNSHKQDPNPSALKNNVNAAGWQQQKSRRNRANTLTTGTGNGESSLKGVIKKIHFHVSRLHPNTNANDVKTHLANHSISDAAVEQVDSKHPQLYTSFKVSVLPEFKENILTPTNWPLGICINRFLWRIQKPLLNS
ncbi:hypothetical protein RI129_009188 [Pyrocoelia pectoralis]|uniref:Uncharacterized protein n=1 Tax=Pyrocoelia pectoralis TaxID=417401 RepID=A0AAN7VDC5_9COLE